MAGSGVAVAGALGSGTVRVAEIAAGETDAVAGGGDEQLVARIDVAVVDAAAVAVFVGVYPGHIGDGGGVGMNASVAQAVGAGVVDGVPAEGVVYEGQVGGAWQFDGLRDGGIGGGAGGRVERQLREDNEEQQRQQQPKKRAGMERQPRHNPAFCFVFPHTGMGRLPRYREVVKFGSVRSLRMVRVADAGQRRKQAESRVLYRLSAVVDDGVVVLHHWVGVIARDAAAKAKWHTGVGNPQPGDIIMKHLVCLLIERLTRRRVVHRSCGAQQSIQLGVVIPTATLVWHIDADEEGAGEIVGIGRVGAPAQLIKSEEFTVVAQTQILAPTARLQRHLDADIGQVAGHRFADRSAIGVVGANDWLIPEGEGALIDDLLREVAVFIHTHDGHGIEAVGVTGFGE